VQQGGNTEKSPYLFTSKELDEETGLYYFGARYYDPRTSVWQSVDPILGDYLNGKRGMGGVFKALNLSLYAYAHFNPLRNLDPDGNESLDVLRANINQGLVRSRGVDGQPGWNQPIPGYEPPSRPIDTGVTAIGLATGVGELKALAAWGMGKLAARQAAKSGPPIITDPARLLPSPESLGRVPNATGEITSEVLDDATIFYRAFGNESGPVGSFLSPTMPASRSEAISGLALPPGNTAESLATLRVQGGVRVQRSTAAEAFGQPGGNAQVELLERANIQVLKVEPLE
jgi:RHS repeat-associated protein